MSITLNNLESDLSNKVNGDVVQALKDKKIKIKILTIADADYQATLKEEWEQALSRITSFTDFLIKLGDLIVPYSYELIIDNDYKSKIVATMTIGNDVYGFKFLSPNVNVGLRHITNSEYYQLVPIKTTSKKEPNLIKLSQKDIVREQKRMTRIANRLEQYPNQEYVLPINVDSRVILNMSDNSLLFSYNQTNIIVAIDKILLSQGGNVYTCPRLSGDSIYDSYMKAVLNHYKNLPETVNFKTHEVRAIQMFLHHNLNLKNKLNF